MTLFTSQSLNLAGIGKKSVEVMFKSPKCDILNGSLSPSAGRKREWFPVEEAIKVLQSHKPVHAEYLRRLQLCSATNNGNILLPAPAPNDNTPRYNAPSVTPRR